MAALLSSLTLVFSVPALYLFMYALLDISLQHSRPLWFVQSDNLEDVGGIDPGVTSAAHDSNLATDRSYQPPSALTTQQPHSRL